MNDESVVEVFQESREVVSKCLLLLDSEPGYSPIINVQKDRLTLLQTGIDDAIQYLKKDRTIICDACSCDITPENCGSAYCKTCAEAAEHCDKIN